jgi:nucleotide-binding universal stress UspA family protein
VGRSLFQRLVCGVDSSPESLEAVRQSDVLLEPDGTLLLVAAVDPMSAVHIQFAPTAIHAARHALEDLEELDQAARQALERARTEVRNASAVTTFEGGGPPADCLIDAAASGDATLVVVGSHGLGRVSGVLLGSVATRVVHRAPCSVLVARRRPDAPWFPGTIVVGLDGSPAADAALRACRQLESRLGSEVRTVTATGRRPAHELVDAAADADLIAVGSRATQHAHGLGSVSERVAHHARCSVLVVRDSGLPGATEPVSGADEP